MTGTGEGTTTHEPAHRSVSQTRAIRFLSLYGKQTGSCKKREISGFFNGGRASKARALATRHALRCSTPWRSRKGSPIALIWCVRTIGTRHGCHRTERDCGALRIARSRVNGGPAGTLLHTKPPRQRLMHAGTSATAQRRRQRWAARNLCRAFNVAAPESLNLDHHLPLSVTLK